MTEIILIFFFIVYRGQPETALRGMSTDYMLT